MQITAQIAADSINPCGNRLTTFLLTMPKFLVAQFNTHRDISRNSASSRAIPTAKIIEQVQTDPFIPIAFGQNQRGMAVGSAISEQDAARKIWKEAADSAALSAFRLSQFGVAKSQVNRLLEPFMWTTVLATATRWSNFFALRCAEDAQPEIQALALLMRDAYETNQPTQLRKGDWHAPLLTDEDYDAASECDDPTQTLMEICIAHCARVSYTLHDEPLTPQSAKRLYNSLIENGHWSPFEHVACALDQPTPSGNFVGFLQYRKTFQNECR